MMRSTLTCAALGLGLLTACSTTSAPVQQAARPTTLLTVQVGPQVTSAQLERQYGGQVQLRTDTFAVIGNPTRVSASSGAPERNARVVRDPAQLSAVAKAIWPVSIADWNDVNDYAASAFSQMADHTAQLWDAQQFLPMPGNSAAFVNVSLNRAHAAGMDAQGAVIAVVDGPMDVNHAALRGALAPASDWRDLANDDDQPTLDGTESGLIYGHATAVAGMALQAAPAAKILPVQVLDHTGSGDLLQLASGIVWAVNHGATVINLSLGASTDSNAVKQAIEFANQRGVMVAAAAGNSGSDTRLFPASLLAGNGQGVAVGSTDAQGAVSSFSSTGDGTLSFAPGEDVLTLYPQNRAAQWSGTSLSTPLVAAELAALGARGFTPAQAYARVASQGRAMTGHPSWTTVDFTAVE